MSNRENLENTGTSESSNKTAILTQKEYFGENLGRTWGEQHWFSDTHTCTENKIKVGIFMTESANYYDEIRKKYPARISKDQFYQIAHISKATALYLLQSGLVPCQSTGKKTRCYSIHIDDVIRYMIDRELHPDAYRASAGWYVNRPGNHVPRITYRTTLLSLSDDERRLFENMISQRLKQHSDLLTVLEVSELTGYCTTTIIRWCNTKLLKSFNISGKFLIPKISLSKFMISRYCFSINRKSWKHLLLIKEFLELRNRKS